MSDIEKRADELRDKFCPPGDYDYSDILDAIIAALTPPDGYLLVPVQPSIEMLSAAAEARVKGGASYEVWLAMIAARPEVK